MRPIAPLIVLFLSLGGAGSLPGQDSGEPLRLTRLTGPIELDGKVNEPAWEAIPPLPLTLFTPTFGAPLTERTEIRVGYDDRFVYVGGRMFDSEARKVRTNTLCIGTVTRGTTSSRSCSIPGTIARPRPGSP